jgi:hypothetical protein
MKRAKSTAQVIEITSKRRAHEPPARLELDDGAVATVEDGGLALRDRGGRLLVRYRDGAAEIAAPSGDLILSSPEGRVVLRSGLDVEIEAERDVTQRAGRNVELRAARDEPQLRIQPRAVEVSSDRVEVTTNDARLDAGVVATIARTVSTRADSVAITAEKYELQAARLFEKSRDAFRDVVDLAQTRVGRARTLVQSIFSVHAGRTVLASKEETSIDGRKILLG